MTTKSLQAFEAQLSNGKLTSDKKKIIERIMQSPQTIDRLVFALSMKYSTVTARVSNLHEMGYVRYVPSPTDNMSFIVYVSDENEREAIRKSVEHDKRAKWLKNGLKMGYLTDNGEKIELSNEFITV